MTNADEIKSLKRQMAELEARITALEAKPQPQLPPRAMQAWKATLIPERELPPRESRSGGY